MRKPLFIRDVRRNIQIVYFNVKNRIAFIYLQSVQADIQHILLKYLPFVNACLSEMELWYVFIALKIV